MKGFIHITLACKWSTNSMQIKQTLYKRHGGLVFHSMSIYYLLELSDFLTGPHIMPFKELGLNIPPVNLSKVGFYASKGTLGGIVMALSVPLCVRCISPIFFAVGIPNLVCGCIL